MSVGPCAFKVSYFSMSFARSRNSEKNPALQRSAISIENHPISDRTPAECYVWVHHIPLRWSGGIDLSDIYRYIAPLEQREKLSKLRLYL